MLVLRAARAGRVAFWCEAGAAAVGGPGQCEAAVLEGHEVWAVLAEGVARAELNHMKGLAAASAAWLAPELLGFHVGGAGGPVGLDAGPAEAMAAIDRSTAAAEVVPRTARAACGRGLTTTPGLPQRVGGGGWDRCGPVQLGLEMPYSAPCRAYR